MTQNQRPLAGIRVLDLTNVLAGPFATHQLAHMGAEIIKIESPGQGDLARQLGLDGELNARRMGALFLAHNAGKKSLTLTLKHEEGRAIFLRLVRSADVVIENFRPGVMERLCLAYETLRAENPRLIYCAISGFGQTGPWAARPAYDQIVQGLSGIMDITGTPETAPLRVGYPVTDTTSGMAAAFAIAAALNAPERGAHIDVSMLASNLAAMGWAVANPLICGVAPTAQGNENSTAAPSGTFDTGLGPINIAANSDAQWKALAELIDRPELAADPRFKTGEDRKANRVALKRALEDALASDTAETWADRLNAGGVPAGAILSVPEVLAHEQVRGQGVIERFEEPPGVGRPVEAVATGYRIDSETPHVANPPPELGADTDQVLKDLGLDTAEIEALRKSGAI